LLSGSAIVYPTVDLPPDAFGTRENRLGDKLIFEDGVDPERRKGVVFMTYLTRVEPGQLEYVGPRTNELHLDGNI
jgi:hypothetical protein